MNPSNASHRPADQQRRDARHTALLCGAIALAFFAGSFVFLVR